MARYLARQGALLVVLLLVGSFVIFLIVDLAPGDPLAALLGTQTPDPERIAQLTAQYHLDKPLPVRYWLWLTSALQGDFGQSIVFQTDVSALLARALPISVTLILMAEALIIVLGVTAAIIAARFRGAPDALVALGSSLFVSVPVFVVAVALSILFGRILGWFPTVGPGDGAIDRVYHLILPAIAIALGASCNLSRDMG